MAEDTFDPRFAMPAVDQDALTEIGVILAGLPADRLLAGLGAATGGDDPALVTLLVDRLRHGDPDALADALSAGARRWRAARPALVAVDPVPSVSASIRQAWERALRTVRGADLDESGRIGEAHLAACWLRRAEIDTAIDRLPSRTTTPARPSA
jgi:hypothetical protein